MATKILKAIVVTMFAATIFNANATSFGLNQSVYTANDGTVSVTLAYDFSDVAMFGGGVDIIYDTAALEFVSYTRADLSPEIQLPMDGSLDEPGVYSGVGIFTNFFNGISSAGDIGTFQFNFLGGSNPASTPCGMTLCMQVAEFQSFITLAGSDITEQVLANSITGATVVVPVPAALWLMLGGLGTLAGLSRNSI
ncbi:MAG: hypothetical protein AB8G18_13570 [Gammaproteobacteria bacterium]